MSRGHRIGETVFDIAFDSPESVPGDDSVLAALVRDRLMPVLEQVLDEFGEGGARIDRLEVDLGQFTEGRFEADLPGRFQDQLRRALRNALLSASGSEPHSAWASQGASASSKRDVAKATPEQRELMSFLETGRVEGLPDARRAKGMGETLVSVVRSDPAGFADYLKRSPRRTSILKRLTTQFAGNVLAEVMRLLEQAHGESSVDGLAADSANGTDADWEERLVALLDREPAEAAYRRLADRLSGKTRLDVTTALADLAKAYPSMLRKWCAEVQAGRLPLAAGTLAADEARQLVLSILGLDGESKTAEFRREIERHARQAKDEIGYYRHIVECMAQGRVVDLQAAVQMPFSSAFKGDGSQGGLPEEAIGTAASTAEAGALASEAVLRARFEAALALGKPALLGKDWDELRREHPELVREVFAKRMGEDLARDRMIAGFDDAFLLDVLRVLVPTDAHLVERALDAIVRGRAQPGVAEAAKLAQRTQLWRYVFNHVHASANRPFDPEAFRQGLADIGGQAVSLSPEDAVRLDGALMEGVVGDIASRWEHLRRHHGDAVRETFARWMGDAGVRRKVVAGFPEPMLLQLTSLVSPSAAAFIEMLLNSSRRHYVGKDDRIEPALWEYAFAHLHALGHQPFDRQAFAQGVFVFLSEIGGAEGRVFAETMLRAVEGDDVAGGSHIAYSDGIVRDEDVTRSRGLIHGNGIVHGEGDTLDENQLGTDEGETGRHDWRLNLAKLESAIAQSRADAIALHWDDLVAAHAGEVREVLIRLFSDEATRMRVASACPATSLRAMATLMAPAASGFVDGLMNELASEAVFGSDVGRVVWDSLLAHLRNEAVNSFAHPLDVSAIAQAVVGSLRRLGLPDAEVLAAFERAGSAWISGLRAQPSEVLATAANRQSGEDANESGEVLSGEGAAPSDAARNGYTASAGRYPTSDDDVVASEGRASASNDRAMASDDHGIASTEPTVDDAASTEGGTDDLHDWRLVLAKLEWALVRGQAKDAAAHWDTLFARHAFAVREVLVRLLADEETKARMAATLSAQVLRGMTKLVAPQASRFADALMTELRWSPALGAGVERMVWQALLAQFHEDGARPFDPRTFANVVLRSLRERGLPEGEVLAAMERVAPMTTAADARHEWRQDLANLEAAITHGRVEEIASLWEGLVAAQANALRGVLVRQLADETARVRIAAAFPVGLLGAMAKLMVPSASRFVEGLVNELEVGAEFGADVERLLWESLLAHFQEEAVHQCERRPDADSLANAVVESLRKRGLHVGSIVAAIGRAVDWAKAGVPGDADVPATAAASRTIEQRSALRAHDEGADHHERATLDQNTRPGERGEDATQDWQPALAKLELAVAQGNAEDVAAHWDVLRARHPEALREVLVRQLADEGTCARVVSAFPATMLRGIVKLLAPTVSGFVDALMNALSAVAESTSDVERWVWIALLSHLREGAAYPFDARALAKVVVDSLRDRGLAESEVQAILDCAAEDGGDDAHDDEHELDGDHVKAQEPDWRPALAALESAIVRGKPDGVAIRWDRLVARHADAVREVLARQLVHRSVRAQVASAFPFGPLRAMVKLVAPEAGRFVEALTAELRASLSATDCDVEALTWAAAFAHLRGFGDLRFDARIFAQDIVEYLGKNGIGRDELVQVSRRIEAALEDAVADIDADWHTRDSQRAISLDAPSTAEALYRRFLSRLSGASHSNVTAEIIELAKSDMALLKDWVPRLKAEAPSMVIAAFDAEAARQLALAIVGLQGEAQTVDFRREIEAHAHEAKDAARYYRHVLERLVKGEVVDLTALNAASADGQSHLCAGFSTDDARAEEGAAGHSVEGEGLGVAARSPEVAGAIDRSIEGEGESVAAHRAEDVPVLAMTLARDGADALLLQVADRLRGKFGQPEMSAEIEQLAATAPSALGRLYRQLQSGALRADVSVLSVKEAKELVEAFIRPERSGEATDFQLAVADHGRRARDEGVYYQRVLQMLISGRLVDLEAAAAAESLPVAAAPVGSVEMASPVPGPTVEAPSASKKHSAFEQLVSRPSDEDEPLEELYIANAGLAIVAPYLQRLFGMLELTADGKFKDESAVGRAIHLTQYVVDGSCDAPEFLLVFNKLLCGAQPAMPIPRRIELEQRERDAVDGMLRAVIQNWKIIGSTSVLGLQESFLQRAGRLQLKGEDWFLKVEQKGIDVLLDQLPWGISVIKYPWMPRMIFVEWR